MGTLAVYPRLLTPRAYRNARPTARPTPEHAGSTLPDDWRAWLAAVSPFLKGFSGRHERLWDHVQAIRPGTKPRSYIAPWPRKGGKSTTGEHAVAYLAEQRRRKLCLYVCEQQDSANEHVAAIETILGRIGGPLSEVAVNTQGRSRGWKVSRKQTAYGFSLVGFGLDSAKRGIKIDDVVPDLIVLDDLDGRHDTLAATKKKIQIITDTILPMATSDVVVFGLQNLIIPHGIFSQLAGSEADFLLDRIVDGPYRAIEGLKTKPRYVEELGRVIPWIVGGEPTWEGQSVADCQNYIITYGWRAFDREMQQNVSDVEGALLTSDIINETRHEGEAPPLTKIAVAIDPATKSKASSDETGLVASGRTADRHGYVLRDRSGKMKPHVWGRQAVLMHDDLTALYDCPGFVVYESNQGGDMVESVVRTACKMLHENGLTGSEWESLSEEALEQYYYEGEDGEWYRNDESLSIKDVHASKGKRARAEPIAQMYEEHAVHHVGSFLELETEWTTWNAGSGDESPNRLDAEVWGLTKLGIFKRPKKARGKALPRNRISDDVLGTAGPASPRPKPARRTTGHQRFKP